MNQPIAIGVEKYKEIIDNNAYYIDKTWMIKELLDQACPVNLFTRPRWFGKTLTLSMIRTFFEDERTYEGKKIDNRPYFEGKKILMAGERYVGAMGNYPVIKLSLKSSKQPDFQMAYRCLKDDIIDEYDRHKYVLNGEGLSEREYLIKQYYQGAGRICGRKCSGIVKLLGCFAILLPIFS